MKFFEVHRTIQAPPAALWALLTDARRIEAAQLGVTRIDGAIKPGRILKLYSEVSPGRAFPLRVTAFVPNRHMVWSGGMPMGLFRGSRQFNLTPVGRGTDFHMREEYTGPMLGLIWPSMPDLSPSFEKFADGLAFAVAGESA